MATLAVYDHYNDYLGSVEIEPTRDAEGRLCFDLAKAIGILESIDVPDADEFNFGGRMDHPAGRPDSLDVGFYEPFEGMPPTGYLYRFTLEPEDD